MSQRPTPESQLMSSKTEKYVSWSIDNIDTGKTFRDAVHFNSLKTNGISDPTQP